MNLSHIICDCCRSSGVECIACKNEALAGGVYCSDECIAKHTADSLAMIDKSSVIVFERKSGRIYSGKCISHKLFILNTYNFVYSRLLSSDQNGDRF